MYSGSFPFVRTDLLTMSPQTGCSRKCRVLDVAYNSSNNELVRTKTLVKNAIISIDATSFRQWYEQHYGVNVGKKKKGETATEKKTTSKKVIKKIEKRKATRVLEPALVEQFNSGRLLACISSRPGKKFNTSTSTLQLLLH